MLMPGYSLYPIGFNEMARIFFKVNVVRIFAASPLIISFAAIAAFKLNHSPLDGAILGAKSMGILLCMQPFLILLPISSTTNDTSRMLSLWLFVFLPVLLILIACAIGVFLSDTALGVVASFVIIVLLSGLLFVVYRRSYRSGKFDLLNPRARTEEG
jgi:hypothetical protein